MRAGFLLVSILLISNCAISQGIDTMMQNLLTVPLQYTVLKTTDHITIDGLDTEKAWNDAPWTEIFSDIVSGEDNRPGKSARCKMLWNDDYLYLYARLDESDIWASITEHDQSVFQDNAFEMFLDIDGNGHNYYEFQINAYGTVWDLFMPSPYRNGGRGLSTWDIKDLKKAIHVKGTINNPADKDTSWSIELAIPFTSICGRNQQPSEGSVWRMNFSRVEWKTDTVNGKYIRKRNDAGRLAAEQYSVWSPQGIVNLHYPERWGYVRFSEQPSSSHFLNKEDELVKLSLWKYYYLQQEFKRKFGKYALTITQLDSAFSGVPLLSLPAGSQLQMEATRHQFWIQCYFPVLYTGLSIDQDGNLRKEDGEKE